MTKKKTQHDFETFPTWPEIDFERRRSSLPTIVAKMQTRHHEAKKNSYPSKFFRTFTGEDFNKMPFLTQIYCAFYS